MNYDFLIQSKEASTSYEVERVETALLAQGAVLQPDGGLRLSSPVADLLFRRLMESGRCVASEVQVSLSDRFELLHETLKVASAVAASAECRLIDPQLGRAVTEQDQAAVQDKFAQVSTYAGNFSGWGPSAGMTVTTPESSNGLFGDSAFRTVLVVFGAALLLGYLLVSRLTG